MSTEDATRRVIIEGMTATEKKQQAARQRLDELSAAYEAAEKELDDARDALNDGIVEVLRSKTLGPSEVTRHVPYERQHVGRIAKAAGIPPLRERTVVSAKKAAPTPPAAEPAPASPQPHPAPATRRRPARPPSHLGLALEVATLSDDQVRVLVSRVEAQHPDWAKEIRKELGGADWQWTKHLMVQAAYDMGYVDLPRSKER